MRGERVYKIDLHLEVAYKVYNNPQSAKIYPGGN